MHSGGAETSDRSLPVRARTYCIVPAHLADKLHGPLRDYFADDPAVEVVVERRRTDRRLQPDRRAESEEPYGGRRAIRNPEGRRIADRRQTRLPVAAPELPRRARRHGEHLVFMERLVPSTEEAEDIDTARLVTRIQAGQPDGFGELYMRYFDRVYAYILMVLHDRHAAEDVTQQAFLKVMEALPGYERRRRPFRAWLFVVIRNTMLNELRSRNRLDLVAPHELEADDERVVPGGVNTDLGALRWITDSDLMLFIERLPVVQRQVLLLRYMLDLPATQIAEILGISPASVRKTQERALGFLRERLAAVGGHAKLRREQDRSPWRRRPTFLAVLHARRGALLH